MYDNQERELKILLTKEQYDKLLQLYDFNQPFTQTNTYYDTADEKLKEARGAVRIRQIGDENIMTMKLPADSITKYEFEYPVHTSKMDEITPEEWAKITEHFDLPDPKDMKKTTQFITQRRILDLPHADLCLDQTTFGDITDYELEYEYTDDHDGITEFNKLIAPVGLEFHNNCLSKLARSRSYNSNL